MIDPTDENLVAACRGGDQSAFAELVDRYQSKIFNAAFRITGNRADAQDATQAAFLKAWQKLDRFDSRYRFFSWIFKIGVNEALNVVGKQRFTTEVDIEIVDPEAGPERGAESKEIGRAIQRALLELRPALRVAIMLRHFQGLTYLEMSEIIGVPVKTVKSRLFTARRELRLKLDAPRPR